ncbi:MAG TPA: aldehyde dehydrogenase family protein, partial [Chitinophagaceae bacterium]|nr:aldehyde dehydrogenase family protein [Chitinophagaceae bacterium]
MNTTGTIDQLAQLKRYFESGSTLSYSFRREQLKALKQSILKHEQDLYDALYADLKKSPEETWVTETGLAIAELNAAIKHLHRWMEPERVTTNLVNLPSGS